MDFKDLLKKERPAQLWKRVFAYVVDILIVTFIDISPFRYLTDKFGLDNKTFSFNIDIAPEKAKLMILTFLIIAILSILYWAILEFKLRQSLGKMLMKIYVKPLTKKLSFWQCILRNITKISTLTIALDSAYMLLTKQHQRYFERLSNTEVVEK